MLDAELMQRSDFESFLESRSNKSGPSQRLIGQQLVKLGLLAATVLAAIDARQAESDAQHDWDEVSGVEGGEEFVTLRTDADGVSLLREAAELSLARGADPSAATAVLEQLVELDAGDLDGAAGKGGGCGADRLDRHTGAGSR